MSKTPRSTSRVRKERLHNPLSEEYSPTAPPKQKAGKKRKSTFSEEREKDGYVDSKSSRRILDLGQDLAKEDEAVRATSRPTAPNAAFTFESRFPIGGPEEDGEDDAEPGENDDEDAWGSEEEVEEVEIDPDDLETFNRFNPSFDPATLLQTSTSDHEAEKSPTNLADLILQKIAAHEAQQEDASNAMPQVHGGGDPDDAVELPAKVVEVYSQVAILLSRYKSGKLPKPFKILPTLPQYDILLSITRPDNWTPNAVYEATKIFSSARAATAQEFYQQVLLPRVRDDIHESKKLNVHLYNALKKTLYKPSAFFKGLVFPLLESGTCTLREATIVSSVVARISIPVLHSAAALFRLCEIANEQMSTDVESAGACNIFIRTLLEKKYALPYKVVDELVFHFLKFKTQSSLRPTNATADDVSMSGMDKEGGNVAGKLPVLWHQCLLAFAQRYKNEIEEEQRESLLDLLIVKGHRQIGPEVRRELLSGRSRGEKVDEKLDGVGGDDTMVDV